MRPKSLMMLSAYIGVIGTVCILLGSCRNSGVEAIPVANAPDGAASASSAQNPYQGKPMARFDLTKLRRFSDDTTLTPQERLAGLLGCWREAMETPTPPALGPGGGPIDSGYVQGVIVGVMGQTVAPKDLSRARAEETNPVLQDHLAVALGLAGDKSVTSQLIEILKREPNGALRQNVAIGLADFKESSVKPTLYAMLDDNYSRIMISGVGGGGISKIYPVREAAARGLRLLGEQVSPDLYTDARRASDVTEAIAWLLEDKDPQVCQSAVTLLGQQGEAGAPYLKAFVEQNVSDPTLQAALEAAQALISEADSR